MMRVREHPTGRISQVSISFLIFFYGHHTVISQTYPSNLSWIYIFLPLIIEKFVKHLFSQICKFILTWHQPIIFFSLIRLLSRLVFIFFSRLSYCATENTQYFSDVSIFWSERDAQINICEKRYQQFAEMSWNFAGLL